MSWVIRNRIETNLYWNNDVGWCELVSADRFDQEEKDELRLPIDGIWMTEEAAAQEMVDIVVDVQSFSAKVPAHLLEDESGMEKELTRIMIIKQQQGTLKHEGWETL